MTVKKKYQVFVSSTFTDLPAERQAVFQTLLKMSCIPAGMEFFGANSEEQLSYIRKVIESSDYYLVILGGRYGSLTDEGVSYTEKEFECALEAKIPIIALLHKDPTLISEGKSEQNPESKRKLAAFRKRLEDKRLADYWENAADLKAVAALAMVNAKENHPMPGWVRGDQEASVEVLNDLNTLRKENELLKTVNQMLEAKLAAPEIPDLADLDEPFTIDGVMPSDFAEDTDWEAPTTWRAIFKVIGPHLLSGKTDSDVLSVLSLHFAGEAGHPYPRARINDNTFQQIKIQLMELKLVSLEPSPGAKSGPRLFWVLTPQGSAKMRELVTVKSAKP